MSPINSFISHSFATATTFPKIVTNGLVFHYDAGQQNSYAGTGTIWRDLSGNSRNGTLTSGPTYNSANGGFFYFDKVDDYVQVPGSITVTSITFFAFIKKSDAVPPDYLNSYPGIIFSRLNANVSGMDCQETNVANERAGLAFHWNGSTNVFGNLRMLNTNDPWRMAAITFTSTTATGYLSTTSNTIASQTLPGSYGQATLDNIRIADAGLSRYFKGNIAVAMVYNRALSSQEIQRNFDAIRGRFNI